MHEIGGRGSPARLERRATQMVAEALAGYLGVDALGRLHYAAKLATPEGATEPQLYVSLRANESTQSAAQSINLRQVFAGAILRELVDGAVRALLEQAGLLEVRGEWAVHRAQAGPDGAASRGA